MTKSTVCLTEGITLKEKVTDPLKMREGILRVEKKISEIPGAIVGHDNDAKNLPLKHTFVDGAYVREIFMPKGTLLTSKIHKVCHPYFIMKGECSVLTDEGVVRLKAPYQGITKPGTKRILYIHEDCTWITIHVTKEKNLDKIEKEIIADNFDEISLTQEEVLKLKEGV